MFFERPELGEKALLVSLRLRADRECHDPEEFKDLAYSAGLNPVDLVTINRHHPDPATCFGKGQLVEIRELMDAVNVDLLLVDHELTATQERNLESKLKHRIMTRTELILHLFETRARTHEGKLQVELALLRHAQSRVTQGWTHLDRQRGGGLHLRGAGERQSTIDRGLIQSRIKSVSERLRRVVRQRTQQRKQRDRREIPTVALVGYTNAGKSTLFNALTAADAYADDRLFATLDPTMRTLQVENVGDVILIDTVGFIRNLPMDLVAAFKATLEEVTRADLLLHVIDSSLEDTESMQEDVIAVLQEIDAAELPMIKVFNKVDKSCRSSGICREGVSVSATERLGFDDLLQLLEKHFKITRQELNVRLAPSAGKIRAWLHELDAVIHESFEQDGTVKMTVVLTDQHTQRLLASKAVSLVESQPEPKIKQITHTRYSNVME